MGLSLEIGPVIGPDGADKHGVEIVELDKARGLSVRSYSKSHRRRGAYWTADEIQAEAEAGNARFIHIRSRLRRLRLWD